MNCSISPIILFFLGGNAVLSLTKDKGTGLGFNDTQASTIAALGNAALILGGKNHLLL